MARKDGKHPAKPAGARPYFALNVSWWMITTAGYSHIQKSALLDLLVMAWQSDPPCTLPADDEQLAAIARTTPEQWAKARAPLMRLTRGAGRGRLTFPYLEEQYDRMCSEHAANVRRGRLGARVRWGDHEAGE